MFFAKHPFFSLSIVGILYLMVSTMDYNDAAKQAQYPIECRKPDADEYRVIIQRREPSGEIVGTCSIEQRDPNEAPSKMMRRLLKRQRVST